MATGLVRGTQYWFRVRAIGAAGPSAWSDPATKRATLARRAVNRAGRA